MTTKSEAHNRVMWFQSNARACLDSLERQFGRDWTKTLSPSVVREVKIAAAAQVIMSWDAETTHGMPATRAIDSLRGICVRMGVDI